MSTTPAIPFLLLALATSLPAQQADRDPRRPFEIADNSFLVEEAFNQEAGIFQNILLISLPSNDEWGVEFTSEWPLGSQLHQLSFTLPLEAVRAPGADAYHVRRGAIAVNYRYQLTTEDNAPFAASPRLSVLIPREDIGDTWGVQINLPFSKQLSDFYVHVNGGTTVAGIASDAEVQWHAAGSLIYRAFPMVHAMLESVFKTDEHATVQGAANDWVISPGLRAGFNLGDHQLVLGAAAPIGLVNENDTVRLITYISYELPFMRR